MTDIDPAVLLLMVPAILGTVEFIKALGLSGKVLTLVSAGLGALLTVLALLLEPGVAQKIFVGILGGLAAAGFYDFGKLIGGAQSTKKPTSGPLYATAAGQMVNPYSEH